MNWRLIFLLSLFGLVMAVATVFWIPFSLEPFCWLAIFIFCAYLVAKLAPGRYFLHGFLVSLVNSVWITSVHVLLYRAYVANHPEWNDMNQQMPFADSPRLMMLVSGPFFGAASGLVLGLLCLLMSRFVKRKAVPHL